MNLADLELRRNCVTLRFKFFRHRFRRFRSVKLEHEEGGNGVRDFFRALGISFKLGLNDVPVFVEVRLEALMQQFGAESFDQFLPFSIPELV